MEKTYRYIIPLYTEEACIKCHRNYKVGEVRGALSIFLPSNQLFFKLKHTKFLFFMILTIFHIIIFSGFFLFFDKFIINPVKKLANYALDSNNIAENEFSVLELSFLFESLKNAKIKDEKIKALLEEEVEKATKELRRINEQKSDFLLQIGHKLKTPLTVISTSIDYLFMKGGCGEEEKYLNLLKRNVSSLKRAVNQILKTAQLDMGISDEPSEKINLKVLLDEIVKLFDQKKIELTCNEDIYVYGSYEKLSYLFENLIHNAIKFNKDSGIIKVIVEKEGSFALIKVIDEGIGIREEDKDRVLQGYKRCSKPSRLYRVS